MSVILTSSIGYVTFKKLSASIDLFLVLTGLNIIFILINFSLDILINRKIILKSFSMLVVKMLGLVLYLFLGVTLLYIIPKNYVVFLMICSPTVLTILKEYNTIGDKVEIKCGKKTYMFVLIDKLFDILEMKFFKHLDKDQ